MLNQPTNGGELTALIQRAQKVADLATQVAAQTAGVDQILGARTEPMAATGGPSMQPSSSHVAAMHEALDRAEQALNKATNDLARLNAALA